MPEHCDLPEMATPHKPPLPTPDLCQRIRGLSKGRNLGLDKCAPKNMGVITDEAEGEQRSVVIVVVLVLFAQGGC